MFKIGGNLAKNLRLASIFGQKLVHFPPTPANKLIIYQQFQRMASTHCADGRFNVTPNLTFSLDRSSYIYIHLLNQTTTYNNIFTVKIINIYIFIVTSTTFNIQF
ncbi:unnamed protein product [Caenorhabditis angaria]|uniref:Uncharacterized protein n=1 Tax=Caenorhabditis angaria TaxID=860376 RepID=A0A9P1N0F4_9PELO|nr:unnamed protein product [Caenorhabditis angaria]